MPNLDITYCSGHDNSGDCPLRTTCRRYDPDIFNPDSPQTEFPVWHTTPAFVLNRCVNYWDK